MKRSQPASQPFPLAGLDALLPSPRHCLRRPARRRLSRPARCRRRTASKFSLSPWRATETTYHKHVQTTEPSRSSSSSILFLLLLLLPSPVLSVHRPRLRPPLCDLSPGSPWFYLARDRPPTTLVVAFHIQSSVYDHAISTPEGPGPSAMQKISPHSPPHRHSPAQSSYSPCLGRLLLPLSPLLSCL